MGCTFQHFEGLSLTLADLRAKYAGQTGVWRAFAPPTHDELGRQAPLGYYRGVFEDVLRAVVLEHRRAFLDQGMHSNGCGEIIPILPQRIPPSQPPAPGVSVLSLLERALNALGAVPTEAARLEVAAITEAVEAMQSAILAEIEMLKACGAVPPVVLDALLGHPSPQVCAWARAVLDARTVSTGVRSNPRLPFVP